MRQFDTDFAAALAGGATTLCTCWRLLRRDGVVLGFTDHDDDLSFGGTIFLAGAGLDTREAQSDLGFRQSRSDVAGAFRADALREEDLAAGRWDGASVETWRVDWSAPSRRILLDVATLGAVKRGDSGFSADLLSVAHLLDQERGRVFQKSCTADLGDTCCKIDLTRPAYHTTCAVASRDAHLVLGLEVTGFASGWFSGGTLTVVSGASAGARVSIKEHRADTGGDVVSLWTALPVPLAVGDRIALTAGCDKLASTCRDRFDNLVNFRGCPLMPGNDVLASYASDHIVMDGGSLLR